MRRGPAVASAALGVALTAAGLWCTRSAASGWTAYSPLAAKPYPVLLEPPWWALALVVLGSVVAGASGALLLRRSSRTGPGPAEP